MTSDLPHLFPNRGKHWFDTNGEITISGGSRNINLYRDEINRYRIYKDQAIADDIDARQLLEQLLHPEKSTSSKPSVIKTTSDMPGPTKRSAAWRKKKGGKPRRNRPLKNKALKSIKVPFKKVVDVDTKKGETESAIYFNDLKLRELEPGLLAIYQEFKCVSMRVRFFPDDVSAGSGLYAAILMDQGGIGAPAAKASVWFTRIADMPGSRICHVTRGFAFDWKPTEPDSRNYRNTVGAETDYSVATLYIFGKTDTTRVKGSLLITGAFRARGESYKSDVSAMISRLRALNVEDHSDDDDEGSIEQVDASCV